ncbi:MAG TPA: hypothetical protein VF172_08605 [Nitrososphaera sp.]
MGSYDVNLDMLAGMTDSMTGAHLAAIVNADGTPAIREHLLLAARTRMKA